ncbi:diaminopimelate decarboxylase [Microbacterium sp.]|uniref:diaminopimelate decarboxylase n=1 Tax=Microbacterium sp. TaxID=51671 RepID=UPI003A93A09D
MTDTQLSTLAADLDADARAILPEEAGVTASGVLTIGGVSAEDLANTYGTPLYVMDETGLRRQIRRFVDGLAQRWPNSEVLFASKSLPAVGMYAIAAEEGMSIDVAGTGELLLALAAGVDPARVYLHGNAKGDDELRRAVDVGVGTIVIDNFDDIDRLTDLVTRPQHVLVRVIPSVAAHTHASQYTGGHDSKFGLLPAQLGEAVARLSRNPAIVMDGVHLHIGSQILDPRPFGDAVEAISRVGTFDVYDVGGGLGVRYEASEHPPTVADYLDTIVQAAREHLPSTARLLIEPGRSVVARAGITIYRVRSVKRTGRAFVAVDGGLSDLLDIGLTDQTYLPVAATRVGEAATLRADIVGRQCESGDLFRRDALLPDVRRGDLLAFATTGAYAYTLANNYNGALKPAMVFVKDGEVRLAVRRETYDDLLRHHVLPAQGAHTS